MDLFIGFALGAAFLTALSRLASRRLMVRGGNARISLILTNIIAVALITLFFGPPELSSLRSIDIWMLLLNGLLWSFIGYLDLRASCHLSASAMVTFESFAVLLIAAVGSFAFGETVTVQKSAAILITAFSLIVIGAADFSKTSRGMAGKFLAVMLLGITIPVDKIMAGAIPLPTIMFVGYAIPALIHTLIARPSLEVLGREFRRRGFYVFALPVLGVSIFYCTLSALRLGDMGVTYAVQQSALLIVYFIEQLLRWDIERPRARAFACALCTVGLILAAF